MVAVPEVIARRRLTFDDYQALPDDQDYEIVDGALYVAPRARPRHQVEIVSPTSERYDRTVKRDAYARIGVPHYWIADPRAHTLVECTLRGERYVERTVAADVPFQPAALPGLALDLSTIFGR